MFAELGRRRLAHWAVAATYVQIYNEALQDLLCPETPASEIAISDQKRAPAQPLGNALAVFTAGSF